MDRFVFRKLSFQQLCSLPDEDLRRLNKKQVFELCQVDLGKNIDRNLIAFAFLGTKYVKYLTLNEVNTVFKTFLPAIATVFDEITLTSYKHNDILNLITVSMGEAAKHLGFPKSQLVYKDLYSAIASLIPSSFNRFLKSIAAEEPVPFYQQESGAASTLLRGFLSYATTRKFLIHGCPEEKKLFEEVLVAILNICQVLLSFDRTLLNEAFCVFFKLIADHKWNAASQGMVRSSSKEWFRILHNFLKNHETSDEIEYKADFQNLHLFSVAILKLFNMGETGTALFECRPSDIMIIYGEFEQALSQITNTNRRMNFNLLMSFHRKLISMTSMGDLIHGLVGIPSSTALLFCNLILSELRDQDDLGPALITFILNALQSNQLVSSEEEFTDLVTEVLLILSDTSECNPMLFAKLLQLFVDFTICATSHICEGLRFAVTIQNIVLKQLSTQSLYTAFTFYSDTANQLSHQPLSPALWAFSLLARECYSYLPKKYQAKAREDHPMSVFTSIHITLARTSTLAYELIELIDQFLQQNINLSRLEMTLYSLVNSKHYLNASLLQQLGNSLDRLWFYLGAHCMKWGRFQWIGPFLHLLVRASVKAQSCNLPAHLKPIAEMKLPQSTSVLILLALLDVCPKDASPLVSFTEHFIQNCNNARVKNYLLFLHQRNPEKSQLLVRLVNELFTTSNDQNTNFPHTCCERTCCFVLANTSNLPLSRHSPIVCNLQHAIDELQRSAGQTECVITTADLKYLEGLGKRFSHLINQMLNGRK